MDTVSAFYVSKIGDEHKFPPLGNYLGELTNVLDDENHVIETFCGGGPKNYGYTIVDVNTGGFVKTGFKEEVIHIILFFLTKRNR